MIRGLIIISLVSTFTLQANAKKVKGFIYLKNDTLEVTFKIPFGFFGSGPDYQKIQNRVVYYDKTGKRAVLKPDEAEEFRFMDEGKEIRMMSMANSLDDGMSIAWGSRIFLKLEIDGKVKLYAHYYTQTNGGTYGSPAGMTNHSYSVDRFLLRKGSGGLKRPRTLTFRKDMLEYFRDCPELCVKIENKEFHKNELESIVEYYNENCN